ncbi:MAG: endonuclease MutS2 [Clostridiales bacterium]|jgi:DNA mismatch repair protein MutS2|nr:endonuclease MutS2 [Clostridiales bacterium]
MNEKTLRILEYNKILEMLKEKCVSQAGKEKAEKLTPSSNIDEINLWQNQTAQSASMIVKKGSLPLGGFRDIRPSVKRAEVAGVLSASELIGISDFLYVCKKITTYGKGDTKDCGFELLRDMFSQIVTLPELEAEINRCVMPPDEVSDGASAHLSSIRRAINVANGRIRDALNSIIHSQNYKTMLQDSVITIRGDRFCVPIKQEFAKSFPGMVHDHSSTGATVFMEPMSVVNLNNQIKDLRGQEKAEIERILRVLSAKVSENTRELAANMEILSELDFIFAKGELALKYNGAKPEFNTEGYIEIRKGRHPLLNKDTVVPTDIYLGKDFTLLLITGPNTGGKTVTLKTIGLFTLMGQAGLHIGAKEGSQLAVFDDVFADIGDEQSIEQNLSTFSSHMSNIVKILSQATPYSLVLLDELGAGTDPTEGAALAIAILNKLHRSRIRAAVTTHYSELKVYALSTEGACNASCEFNVETLRPTYKLLIGIPGKSNAFEISRRLGLTEDIISDAKNVLSKEDARFEDVITDLEISRKSVLLEKERAESFRLEAEKLKKEFEAQKEKLEAQKEKIIAKAKEDARMVFVNARDEADTLLREYKQSLKESKQHDINTSRQKIFEKASELSEFSEAKLIAGSESYAQTQKPLKAGDRVIAANFNKQGIIVTPPDSGGEALVQLGIIKTKIHISNLYEDKTEKAKPKPKAAPIGNINKAQNIKPELDIRGATVEEGLERCGKYLDDAYLANLGQVVIIHGKGTGVLRNAVQAYLKGHMHVKSCRGGEYGEGDSGVTIAELKK